MFSSEQREGVKQGLSVGPGVGLGLLWGDAYGGCVYQKAEGEDSILI